MLVIELNDLAYHFMTNNEYDKAIILLKRADKILKENKGVVDV
jgi:hypothetical protein